MEREEKKKVSVILIRTISENENECLVWLKGIEKYYYLMKSIERDLEGNHSFRILSIVCWLSVLVIMNWDYYQSENNRNWTKECVSVHSYQILQNSYQSNTNSISVTSNYLQT